MYRANDHAELDYLRTVAELRETMRLACELAEYARTPSASGDDDLHGIRRSQYGDPDATCHDDFDRLEENGLYEDWID